MKHFAMNRLVVLIAGVLFVSANLDGAVPNIFHHQGRVAVNGVNFDGAGSFKFLLFTDTDANHANGGEVALWKNDDAAPANMNEPLTAVPLLVSKGLYALNLGDTGQAALPASIVPPEGRRVYLRIWFDNGVNGLQQLAPDQELAAVPFARHAETAAGFSGNLNLGASSVTAQTFMVGQPGQTVSMTSSPNRLTIVGNLEVEGMGESRFLGNVEIENELVVGTVNSNLSPHVDNALDLGISARRWRQLVLGPTGLSIGDSGDLATLSFNPAADLLTISRDTRVGGRLMWGDATDAAGIGATAWGATTLASGDLSSAWGYETKAGGEESTAWGRLTLAAGIGSTAWGLETTAPSYLETALGRFNTGYAHQSAVAWDPADRLFVIGNGTSDTNRSDALVILKNGAASFGGAVSVAGNLNVTGAVNYGSLTLPPNVMLEGESVALLNNDAGFLASPGGTVAVPESQVHTAALTHASGATYDGTAMQFVQVMASAPAGAVAVYSQHTQEMVYLWREVDGTFTERLRRAATPPHFLGFTLGDGLSQIVMDTAHNFAFSNTYDPNIAYVLSATSRIKTANLFYDPGTGTYYSGFHRQYQDDSVLPGSQFSKLQNPTRAALSAGVMAVLAEGAVTFIDMTQNESDPAARLAVFPASPTTLIAGAVDVVVGGSLAAVASTGDDAVQLFGISRAGAITIGVKGAAVEGQNGFTRLNNVNRLAYNDASLLAASSTTENAITLINVSDPGTPQPMAVIEGAASRMLFADASTLVVQRPGHLSVLDVSAPGSPVEKMRLTAQNTTGMLPANSIGTGLALAGPGLLAVAGESEIRFIQISQPPATQSLAVSGWLGLGGVERAYAPLHVQGDVLVQNAGTIRMGSANIVMGNGAEVVNGGVAIGPNAVARNGGSAFGSSGKALAAGSLALSGGLATGINSTAMGVGATAGGTGSFAIGNYVNAASYRETVIGSHSTTQAPLNATDWNPLDRLFVIGNGSDFLNISDALVMLKNGSTTLNGSLTVNGGATINGSVNLTGTVTGGGLAQLTAPNVFTQNVTTQADYKYAAPKTGKVRVHARAFAPASWFTSRNVDYAFENAFLYLEDNPNGTARFNAGVDLPAGAVITKVGLHYMDAQGQGTNGDDNFNAHLSLRYFDPVTGTEGGVAGITLLTTGIDGDIKTEEVIVNHTVGANRAYGLRFQMTNCAGNDLRFYGVTIEYQTTTVQP